MDRKEELQQYREYLKTLSTEKLMEEYDRKRAVLKPDAAGLEECSGKIIIDKITPQYFESVKNGSQKFVLQKDKHRICVGDFLVLKEWDNIKGKHTGEQLNREVKYVLRNHVGLKRGYCVVGF